MDKGYIKIYRSMLDWKWHDDAEMISLWIHLLCLANYEDNEWHDIIVKRGQLVTSVRNLSTLTGLTSSQVDTRLKKLEKTGEIQIKSGNKYSVITICKYDNYQSFESVVSETNQKQIGNKTETNPNQIGIKSEQLNNIRNKEINNNNILLCHIEEKKPSSEVRKAFVKPTIEEIKSYLEEKNYTDIDAEHFFSYYESQGWKVGKSPMKNWRMAITTWHKNNNNTGYGAIKRQESGAERRGTCATAVSAKEYSTTF